MVQTSGAARPLSEDTVAGVGWAHGRTWSRQVHLSFLELGEDLIALPLRLRIVEARPVGDMRTTLTAREVPVRTRQPRLPSPPTHMPKRLD
jgi:cell division septation protein DedD